MTTTFAVGDRVKVVGIISAAVGSDVSLTKVDEIALEFRVGDYIVFTNPPQWGIDDIVALIETADDKHGKYTVGGIADQQSYGVHRSIMRFASQKEINSALDLRCEMLQKKPSKIASSLSSLSANDQRTVFDSYSPSQKLALLDVLFASIKEPLDNEAQNKTK